MPLSAILPITVTWRCDTCGETDNPLTHCCSGGFTPTPSAA